MTGKLLEQVMEYATAPEFSEEVFKAREEFKGRVGEIYEDDQSYDNRMSHFLEWYVFDRNLRGKTITPLLEFIETRRDGWSEETVQDFMTLAQNIHGLFQIKKIARDHVVIYNFFNDSKYKVMEEQSQLIFRKNDLFEGRIIPGLNGCWFTGAFCFHPQESEKFIKKEIGKLMDQLEFHENQLKKLRKEKSRKESDLIKTNDKLNKLIEKIENASAQFKRNRLESQWRELDGQRIKIEEEIADLNESIFEIRTVKIQSEGQNPQNQLMLRLARMSLKWERFRQIDIKDIYTN